MQLFSELMYEQDFVFDLSVSASIPICNTYGKVGVSKVLSPNKYINASYFHMGFGQSTPSILPISMSYSFGMVRGVDIKEYYAGPFYDVGFGAVYGFDYCWWNPGARTYSMTIGN